MKRSLRSLGDSRGNFYGGDDEDQRKINRGHQVL